MHDHCVKTTTIKPSKLSSIFQTIQHHHYEKSNFLLLNPFAAAFLNSCNQPATSAVVIPDAIKADADDVLVYTAKATGVCTCRWRVLFCLCSKTNPVYTL